MSKVISYHTFIFPFSIEEKDIEKKLEKYNWKKETFKKEGILDDEIPNYNEYMYFYENVRKFLYGNSRDDRTSIYYEYSNNDLGDYIIKKSDENEKIYKLKIKSICLRVIQGEIGILSFHLENNKYINFEEILEINQYGRRVYPPYYTGKGFELPEDLAKEIEITGLGIKTEFNKMKNNLEKGKELDFIKKIIGENIEIKPTLDDRMFVLCWYVTPLAKKIGREIDKKEQEYINEWYKFVFIDTKNSTCQNKKIEKNLIEKHTYKRWSNYGTLYGISRYSFVCLLSSNIKFLTNHMKTMYYQMLVLVFVQRISILNFKNKISDLLSMEKTRLDEVENLYQRYLEFINKICIREVTAQEQGIELYNKLWEVMGIEKQSKELKTEIEELFNLSRFKLERKNQKEQDEINNKLNIITTIGGTLAITGTLIALVDLKGEKASNSALFFCIILTIILGCIFYAAIRKYDFKKFKREICKSFKKNDFFKLIVLIILILIIWVLIYP